MESLQIVVSWRARVCVCASCEEVCVEWGVESLQIVVSWCARVCVCGSVCVRVFAGACLCVVSRVRVCACVCLCEVREAVREGEVRDGTVSGLECQEG